MSDQATARPWVAGRTFSTHNAPTRYWETGISAISGEGPTATTSGASREEAEANAELIVRAVNAHDALVAALKEMRRATQPPSSAHRLVNAYAQVREALKLAGAAE